MQPDLELVHIRKGESFAVWMHGYPFRTVRWHYHPEYELHLVVATSGKFYIGDHIGDFEPFFFERKGLRPDGTQTHVAFTLAFAADAEAPDAGFFVCQQHFPENFWNSAFQMHENGGTDITAVCLAASEPARHEAFLGAFTGAVGSQPGAGGAVSYPLDGGRLDLVSGGDAGAAFTSFTIAVPDLDAQASRLSAAGIAFDAVGACLAVPASSAFGVEVRFEHA